MCVIHFIFFLNGIAVFLAGSSCGSADKNVKKLAKANNELGLNIYQQLAKSSGNIFFSPLSLSSAFGMLYYGTKGDTAKELRQALGYEAAHLPEELVHPTFQHYLTEILPSTDPNAYVLSSANAALLDKNFDVQPSYEKEMQNYYQATVKKVDFTTANQEITQEVNQWVKDKTNGKIKKLLDRLDPSTLFVLLNAVYFKGTWKSKFETRETKPQEFYNYGLLTEAKKIPMMKLTEKFLYTTNSEHKIDVIEMPYKGQNISMIIFLPHERDGLIAFEKNLSLKQLNNIRSDLFKTKVVLTLPKFKVEYSKEMSNDFEALGAKSIFSPGGDFSGMTKSKNVYVSQVIHKAVVEVNEEGSEAAAVTGLILSMSAHSSPQDMTVDHPFLFAIIDKRNDMILFVGRVTNL